MPLVAAVLLTTVLAATMLFATATSAAAEPEPVPDAPRSSVIPRAEVAFAIDSPRPGAFVGSDHVSVSGTKEPGRSVQITLSPSTEPVCIVPADDSATFTCRPTLTSGRDLSLNATEIDSSTGAIREAEAVVIDVLTPPTISGDPGQLTSGFVSGTGFPGAQITLRAETGQNWSFPVPASGQWSHGGPRDLSGGAHTLTATQTAPGMSGTSNASSAATIVLDREAPSAPVVTSPVAGSRLTSGPVTFAGTGETDAAITLYLVRSSSPPIVLCQTIVTAGEWQCQAAVDASGSASVTAFQQDQAGNPGPSSAALALTFGDASSPPGANQTPQPAPSGSPDPTRQPGDTQQPGQTGIPGDPEETPHEATAPVPGQATPFAQRTPFTLALPTAFGADSSVAWLRAALVALAAMLVLVVPARLALSAAGVIRSAPAAHASGTVNRGFKLTGRNRPRATSSAEVTPDSSPGWRVFGFAAAIVVAAAAVMLAHPIGSGPEFLRLFVASVGSMLAVNVVSVVGAWIWNRRHPTIPVNVRFSPALFSVVIASVVLSRMLSLETALLFGLVLSITPSAGQTAPQRSRVALARVGGLLALGTGAWLVSSTLPRPMGFADSLGAEAGAIVALTAFGSAAIILMPFSRSSGAQIYDASRIVWFAITSVAVTALLALMGPDLDSTAGSLPPLPLLIGGALIGAAGLSYWLWRRFVSGGLANL